MIYTKSPRETDSNLIIRETNTFRGIPYADYFSVDTEWHVRCRKQGQGFECDIDIYLEVVFFKSTWLQGTIESNTRAELITVYEKWQECAKQHLKSRQVSQIQTQNVNIINDNQQTNESAADDVESQRSVPSSRQSYSNLHHNQGEEFISINEDESLGNLISYVSAGDIARPSMARSTASLHSSTQNDDNLSDEELLFYDCEEGIDRAFSSKMSRNRRDAPTPQELHDLYSKVKINGIASLGDDDQSSRAIAVNVVETIIVLAQFSYWKV